MAENINVSPYKTFAEDGGANVGFKLGTQTALNTLISSGGAEEGTFYLASDTHRLYIGRKNATSGLVVPVPVNEGITTVVDQGALSNVTDANIGDFYYIESGNILAICSKITGTGASRQCSWIQVNTATSLAPDDNAVRIGAKSDGKVSVTTTVNDTAGNVVTGVMNLEEGSNVTLTPDTANKKITVTAKDTTYTVGTTRNGYIDGSAINVAQKSAKINLTDNNSPANTQTVTLIPGQNMKGIKDDGNGNITFDVDDTALSSIGITAKTGSANGFKVAAGTGSGTVQSDFDPIITIGNGTTTDIHFVNGKAVLDVYTKAQTDSAIDSKIQAFNKTANAMTYKGVISSASQLPDISNASIGDTYKIGTDMTLPIIGNVKVGDLVIAYGSSEDENGKISGGGEWQYVPSGDDQVLTGALLTHGFSISDQDAVVGGITLTGDDWLTMTDSAGTGKNAKLRTVAITHANVARTNTQGNDGNVKEQQNGDTMTVSLITGVTSDAKGHVTGVETTQIKFVDTHANLSSSVYTTANSNASGTKKTTITNQVADTDGAKAIGAFALASQSLDVSGSGSTVTVNLVWGTF